MAQGRTTSLTIRLTPAQRRTLLAWQRSTTLPAGLARRSRMLLLLADGVPISHIANVVGISRRFVYKWAQRFLQEGIAGLTDKPGRGHRPEPGMVTPERIIVRFHQASITVSATSRHSA